uniref:PlsC domain-containing protein n=1 Tax=Panagrellus redivivus TaxID=6233 RepID=A0A7E4VJ96_PANRE
MVPILLSPSTEQFLLLMTFMFPPVLFCVVTVILLATFGQSLGLREWYVQTLVYIFEWAATDIRTARRLELRLDSEEEGLDTTQEENTDYESDHSHPSLPARKTSAASTMSSPLGPRHRSASAQNIIVRSAEVDRIHEQEVQDGNDRSSTILTDGIYFMRAGLEAIVEDNVTCRFQAEELAYWNMLTRTSHIWSDFISWRLNLLYYGGVVFRYGVLLPTRLVIFVLGLTFLVTSTAVLGLLPECSLKRYLNEKCMLACYRILSRCVSAVIYFHDKHNKAKNGGICVANHTSPIDVMILSTDHCYALIGQSQGGLLGVIQRALARATTHIWFERSESRDRSHVANALRTHAENPNNLPVLIFPEGTCINNTSVMQFKKGSFEAGQTVYPIAMKYDPRFGDAYWNSHENGWFHYLLHMMSSWAIICNVWYLPAMNKGPNESAVQFANRVKRTIASRGGLVDMEWDGQLKRQPVSQKLIAETRSKYSERLHRIDSDAALFRQNQSDASMSSASSSTPAELNEVDADVTQVVSEIAESLQDLTANVESLKHMDEHPKIQYDDVITPDENAKPSLVHPKPIKEGPLASFSAHW